MKYQGGKVGSLANLREQLKKGGGGGAFIKNVPQNDVMTVRFLTEPDEWYRYREAYDTELRRYYPVPQGQEPGDGVRVSNRFLACVLDVAEDKVIPLKLTKDLANRITMRYDRYDTIMDRDYELSRMGEGLDTTYDCAPGDKVKRNLSKYTLLDLDEVLEQAADFTSDPKDGGKKSVAKKAVSKRVADDDDDDDDDDDEPTPPKRPAPAKKRAADDDDDTPPVDEDDGDDDDEPVSKVKKPAPKPAPAPAAAKPKAKPAPEPEPDDDDEPFDDTEDDGDGDNDSYSEAELNAMSLRDLRALADAFDIDHTGMDKSKLVNAILYE